MSSLHPDFLKRLEELIGAFEEVLNEGNEIHPETERRAELAIADVNFHLAMDRR